MIAKTSAAIGKNSDDIENSPQFDFDPAPEPIRQSDHTTDPSAGLKITYNIKYTNMPVTET